MKKIIISALIGALFGGVGVFMAIKSDFIKQNQVVSDIKKQSKIPENEKIAIEDKKIEKTQKLPTLKVEVFPFEKNYMTHEYVYSTVNPEHSAFCEMQDPKYFGKNADEYITKGDLVGCILEQQGDTEKEVNIALENALDILLIDGEFDDEKEKNKEFEKLHNQWVQLRDKQCELSAKSTNKMNSGADRYLEEQSCINLLNKQYIMFLKTI